MRRVAFVLTGVLTVAGCASGRAASPPAPASSAAAPTAPASTAPTLAVTTTSGPASTAPGPAVTVAAAPAPAPAPADDATEPLVAIGEIAIARLGVDDTLYEGVTLGTLDHGPGHWPGTARPGEAGNAVIAGHRVSHSRPFRHLDRLREGDEVVFTVDGRRSVYVVTGHEIVTPDRVDIVDPTPTPTATLFACHPPGSTRFRYVVHLALSANA